ncbi:hypothetical protein QUF64_08765 [Anaerolineales bacterium HSG6]|nr:hypothetical protein [Anaerolineales bacterium HSG6]MDM8530586.1 hypothetical protein [Anaerolineales bacterium HSG25]
MTKPIFLALNSRNLLLACGVLGVILYLSSSYFTASTSQSLTQETEYQAGLSLLTVPERQSQDDQRTATQSPPLPESEFLVTYFHLTTVSSANEILINGLKPSIGQRSGNDGRFFAFTQERGPYPRPTTEQIEAMLSDIGAQLELSQPDEIRTILYLKISEDVVFDLEQSSLIHYGPFYPMSEAGYTETIFEVSSFPVVNQYRHLWYTN